MLDERDVATRLLAAAAVVEEFRTQRRRHREMPWRALRPSPSGRVDVAVLDVDVGSEPSPEDRDRARRFEAVEELVDLRILDPGVAGDGSHPSFVERRWRQSYSGRPQSTHAAQ